jgi:amino acid transporter
MLRLLVTARPVLILVLAALFACTSGNAWVTVVSNVVLWLIADRLLGRWALHHLEKVVKDSTP